MAKAWRNDITGLRALAVVPVLLFHSFPNSVPNGFLGVDIFFVISGYLISGIIFRGLKRGDFSWTEFYSKRVKRIIPNLLAVLLFVGVLGWFFLTATEYSALGRAIFGSAFFFENLRLLSRVGYFDPAAIYKPLLHVWSLSVEEQFYIFFPLLCMLIWRVLKRPVYLLCFIVTLTAVSLFWYLSTDDRSFAFYFPLTRFWELSFGICLAWGEVFKNFTLPRKVVDGLSLIAVSIVCFCFFAPAGWFVGQGYVNLFCVLGALGLLASGSGALVNRTILSIRPVVYVGLISYSLYLWSWPMNSFQVMVYPEGGVALKCVVLLFAFLVSAFAYKYLENPVRVLRGEKSRKAVIILLILLVTAFASGQIIRKFGGFPDRAFNKANILLDQRFEQLKLEKAEEHVFVNGVKVRSVFANKPLEILVVGDSHAEHNEARLVKLSKETGKNVGFLTQGGCLLVPGIAIRGFGECTQKAALLPKLLDSKEIKTVLFAYRWGEFKNTVHYSSRFEYDGSSLSLGNGGFQKAMEALKGLMLRYQDKNYFILLDAPWDHGSYDLRNHLSRLKPNTEIKSLVVPYPKLNWWCDGNDYVESVFEQVSTIIHSAEHVCPNEHCDLLRYRDDNHLMQDYLRDNAFWLNPVFVLPSREEK